MIQDAVSFEDRLTQFGEFLLPGTRPVKTRGTKQGDPVIGNTGSLQLIEDPWQELIVRTSAGDVREGHTYLVRFLGQLPQWRGMNGMGKCLLHGSRDIRKGFGRPGNGQGPMHPGWQLKVQIPLMVRHAIHHFISLFEYYWRMGLNLKNKASTPLSPGFERLTAVVTPEKIPA